MLYLGACNLIYLLRRKRDKNIVVTDIIKLYNPVYYVSQTFAQFVLSLAFLTYSATTTHLTPTKNFVDHISFRFILIFFNVGNSEGKICKTLNKID